ncbi:MAG: Mur ligase family protein, partial [Thermoanaerobaculia bacterium]
MTVETPWNERDVRRAVVYGLGLSGRAASRLLLALGARVVGVDARPAEALDLGDLAGQAGFELRAGGEPGELPAGIDAVVVSPGVPLDRPLLADARRLGVPVLAEVELAVPFLDGPLVGITGSNGKSTTTALAGAMLRAGGFDVSVCGNIGTPLSAEVDAAVVASGAGLSAAGGPGPDEPDQAGRVYVVELSSFQLQAVRHLRPRAAALLNLAADHLDRHGGLEAYGAAKRRIFENQGPEDVAVVNADDPLVRDTVVRARRRAFSLAGPVDDGCFLEPGPDGSRVLERGAAEAPGDAVELFRPEESPLAGRHNLANAMAAALLARALGATAPACRRGLAALRGLPHRMERVAEAGGVAWYDDSKGTNPAATLGCL